MTKPYPPSPQSSPSGDSVVIRHFPFESLRANGPACRQAGKQLIEPIAKVFFCGSTSSPRTEKFNDFNLSPFTLSLSKGKLRTFAITLTDLICQTLSHWFLTYNFNAKFTGSRISR
jgi:hypothetical protein